MLQHATAAVARGVRLAAGRPLPAAATCRRACASTASASAPFLPPNMEVEDPSIFDPSADPAALGRAKADEASSAYMARKPGAPIEMPVVSFADGAEVDRVELDPQVFGLPPRPDVVHSVLRWKLRKMHKGTNATKRYATVRGGGRKVAPQKGRGMARHGSIRAPIFRGGVKAHGPVVRDKTYKIPQKMVSMAMRSLLSDKLAAGELTVVDAAELESPRTAQLKAICDTHGWTDALLVGEARPKEETRNLFLASRNMAGLDYRQHGHVDVYKMLFRTHLVLTRAAVDQLHERLAAP